MRSEVRLADRNERVFVRPVLTVAPQCAGGPLWRIIIPGRVAVVGKKQIPLLETGSRKAHLGTHRRGDFGGIAFWKLLSQPGKALHERPVFRFPLQPAKTLFRIQPHMKFLPSAASEPHPSARNGIEEFVGEITTVRGSVDPVMGVVTLEMKTTFMRPAKVSGTEKLVAKGHLMHRTRSMAFTEGHVFDADGQLCAHATGTFKYVKRQATEISTD